MFKNFHIFQLNNNFAERYVIIDIEYIKVCLIGGIFKNESRIQKPARYKE